jgi:hypothetical protein
MWNLVSNIKGRTKTVGVSRVLRGMFDPKGQKVKGGLRKLHNEELNKLCISLNITRVKIRVITSRRMR